MDNAPKPAYVQFELRAVEDRTRSLTEGRYVSRDEIFAIITPAGTKDRIEKVADEWIKSVEEGVKQERIPPSWYDAYSAALKRFRESRENPEFGTSVKNWPAISPAQADMLLNCNLRTIEEVAAATEEAVQRIGMGGVAMRQKAQAYLDAARGDGVAAAELESLRQENAELRARDTEREEQFRAMARRLDALEGNAQPAEVEEVLVDEEED
jgi:hypothetical protein